MADETLDFGPCCACGGRESVRNLICLDKKGPMPGRGWSCLVCGLPADGAVAVICDRCVQSAAEIREVCAGFPTDGGRVPIEALLGEHRHDLAKHPELPESVIQ
jgi:hypothetical protein